MLSLLVPPLRTNEHPCGRDLLVALPHADFPDLQGYESAQPIRRLGLCQCLTALQASQLLLSSTKCWDCACLRQGIWWKVTMRNWSLEWNDNPWHGCSLNFLAAPGPSGAKCRKRGRGRCVCFRTHAVLSSRHHVFVILMMQWFVSSSVSLTPLGIAQRFKQATWTVWIFV